jgi:hypothetical protein
VSDVSDEDCEGCSYDYYDNTVLICPVFISVEKNKFICQGETTYLPEKWAFHGDDCELFSDMWHLVVQQNGIAVSDDPAVLIFLS